MKTRRNTLSIIVPVFNEEKTVLIVISLLKQLLTVFDKEYPDLLSQIEILIVDDGSSDKSVEIIDDEIKNSKQFKFIKHKRNSGKGKALSTALSYAIGDICIIQDADLEYDPFEIPMLINTMVEKQLDVVYGSRFLELNLYNGLWSNLLGNKFLSFVVSILLHRKITDMMTCYKVFKRELLVDIESNGFDVEPEITVKLLNDPRRKFVEIPIKYNPRKKGKKIKKIDGLISLWRLIRTIVSYKKNTPRDMSNNIFS